MHAASQVALHVVLGPLLKTQFQFIQFQGRSCLLIVVSEFCVACVGHLKQGCSLGGQ